MDKRFEIYKPAPTSLLEADPEICIDADLSNNLKEKAHKLEDAFRSFGVDVNVVNISHGPSVTRFELTAARGTKISSIFALEEDLQLALAAYSLRIEAPIRGKSAFAIEIPNEVKEKVHLRNLVEKYEYSESSPLTVVIGRDVDGRAVYSDLANMYPLLIAGNMGSGTVMCYNSILTSLLVHSSPEDVRLILIDPKIVEFYPYKNIPHLLAPVINEPKKGISALIWTVNETERRLKHLEECQIGDIDKYNEKYKNDPDKDHIPHILILISELSGLMIDYSSEVEKCLARIVPRSRAAGIHLILATQRPTSDVITSNVYNNIGSRIAFAVLDATSSNVILHEHGAEKLLGQGDMLYFPINSPNAIRVQGVFVREEETEAVVDYLRKKYGDMYDDSVIKGINSISSCGDPLSNLPVTPKVDDGELFDLAVQIVLETGSASVSVLQRRLGIGYPRAARLIDELEKNEIISPFNGAMPRKILITEKEWQDKKTKSESAKNKENTSKQCAESVPESIVDEVLTNADIASVVSRYVTLTRKGTNMWGLCPFHKEKSPSFSVNPSKGIYKCFGCGKGGNSINFIMEIEKLTYPDAVKHLGRLYGVEIPENGYLEYETKMNEKKRIKDILLEASEFYYKSYNDEYIGKSAREFASQRGIPKQTLDNFGIGYSPKDGTALYDSLKEKGFKDEEMLKSGIFAIPSKTNKPYDILRGRLIFPIFDVSGNVIAFGGRSLGDESPKYLYSADSLIYCKQNNLYAINFARKEEYEQFILVEGIMDVLSLYSAGVKNAVAVLGLSITNNQIKLCSKYGKDIVLFFDSDVKGQKAALRAIEMLMDYLRENNCLNIRIKIANITSGKDPAEFIKEYGPEKIKEAIRNASYVEEYLSKKAREDNTDPFTGVLDQWKYQEDICRYASWMNDEIKISRMAGVAAPLLGATQDVVMNEIQKIIERREEANRRLEEANRRLANTNRSKEN